MQISLEELSNVIAAIHAAAEYPERWPEAISAVASLVDLPAGQRGGHRSWETMLSFDPLDDNPAYQACEPSVKRVMTLLAPHFKTAKQVQTRLAEALPGRLALASLDRLVIAAFIVDGAAAVHHLNASARALLAEVRCVRIGNARLRFIAPDQDLAFAAALRRATRSGPHSSLLPLSSSQKEVYEVTVSQLLGDKASALPLALVVIARSRPDAKSIVRRVRRLYGLTEAEGRVMAALTLGAKVHEVAIAHGVCTSTVRAQVRSIFDKTGVNRQTDLVLLALAGSPLVQEPD